MGYGIFAGMVRAREGFMEAVGKLLNQILGHYEKKEYDAAEKAVDVLLASHPDFHRGQFMKAVILEETGRTADAEKYYAKAGNRYTLWSRLAVQLHDIDPDRAIIYYERTAKMDPQNSALWYKLGELYEKKGRSNDARECYRSLSPVKEVLSKIFIPLGFMIFLLSGGAVMFQRGERGLAVVVFAAAVFCVFWLKRDAGTAVRMVVKKSQAR
jgi:tetratricopeptide (TPR) repeat protein